MIKCPKCDGTNLRAEILCVAHIGPEPEAALGSEVYGVDDEDASVNDIAPAAHTVCNNEDCEYEAPWLVFLDYSSPKAEEKPAHWTDNIHGVCHGKHCSCDGGALRERITDAKGIFVAYVCDECRRDKLSGYRPGIFDIATYAETIAPGERIEPED
jgi:hypothetical protein